MSDNIHYQKGLSKVKENRFEEAIELFSLAITEEADNPFIYNERAVCYLNLEKYELSLFDMNKSIELDEKYAYFYSCRGFLKARIKDFEGALTDYEISLELDPHNDITYNNMGLLLEQMGNMPGAQTAFNKANEKIGYDPEKREFVEEKGYMVNQEENEKEKEKKDRSIPKSETKTGHKEVEIEEDDIKESKVNSKEGRQIAGDVFRKKSVFREFLSFISNGFKLEKSNKTQSKEKKSNQ